MLIDHTGLGLVQLYVHRDADIGLAMELLKRKSHLEHCKICWPKETKEQQRIQFHWNDRLNENEGIVSVILLSAMICFSLLLKS